MGIFKRFFDSTKGLTFVHIGANDGKRSDPIWKYVKRDGWCGVFVEPQEEPLKKLMENYKGVPHLHFENVAITEKNADWTDFYEYPERSVSSSLHLDHHKIKDGWDEGKVRVITVRATTFNELIKKYGLIKLDVLVIDTEGYDFNIIRSIDFDYVKPRVICYEHAMLPDADECIEFLSKHGYEFESFGQNKIAYLK